MLSMPMGTDVRVLKQAAREFASAELADHRYVMVLQLRDWGIEAEASSQATRGESRRSLCGWERQPGAAALRRRAGRPATPCVPDPDSGGDGEDKAFVRDTLRCFEVDAPTFSYKLKTAIRDGYRVPYQIYRAPEGGFEVKKPVLDWSVMDAETCAGLDKLFGDKETITVDPSALERRFTIPKRNRAIVPEYRQVLQQGHIDAKGVLHKSLLGQAIVFAVTKKHAEPLARLFDAAFAHFKPTPDVRF